MGGKDRNGDPRWQRRRGAVGDAADLLRDAIAGWGTTWRLVVIIIAVAVLIGAVLTLR